MPISILTEEQNMNFGWEGWQHYRKIEGNAGGVFEEKGTRVLAASGEPA